ncbi:MAG: ferritin-like domain-containing protein [Gammaproteobacteria bacterium]
MSHLKQIQELRERARQHISEGAVTGDYGLDREKAIAVLNEALATEIVCVLRYRFHYFMASGIHSAAAKKEFLEHANEEQQHADSLAERIKQLGGKPEMNPDGLSGRSHSEYKEGTSVMDMLKEDLIAERIAIESYRDMVRFFGDKDPTTRRLIESILAVEEEHADDLADLMFTQPAGEEAQRSYFKDEVGESNAGQSAAAKPAADSKAPSPTKTN